MCSSACIFQKCWKRSLFIITLNIYKCEDGGEGIVKIKWGNINSFFHDFLQENEAVSEYPAVIVEPVPSARIEQGYAAQIFVYDDETYLLQDVAEEQEVETETVKTGRLYKIVTLLWCASLKC